MQHYYSLISSSESEQPRVIKIRSKMEARFTCIFVMLIATLVVCMAQDSRQSPQSSPTKQSSNTTCGSTADMAAKIEACARPLMNIMEGTLEKKIENEKDCGELCASVSFQ